MPSFWTGKIKDVFMRMIPSDYEIDIVRKDGEVRHLQVWRKRVLWNGKEHYQVIYRDITDRKQAEKQLQDTLESLRKAVGTTIQVMVSAVETRDPYTAGHQTRSADLARAIATEMGLTPGENRRHPDGRFHP